VASVTHDIEVDVPVGVAYNQWTQFESFPQFMNGVVSIHQRDDTHTHWKTSVGGVHREFDAEIVEQRPDEVIAWRSVDGSTHAGLVTFEAVNGSRTRITVVVEWLPEGLVEKVGAAVSLDEYRVSADLQRFKSSSSSVASPPGHGAARYRSTGARRQSVLLVRHSVTATRERCPRSGPASASVVRKCRGILFDCLGREHLIERSNGQDLLDLRRDVAKQHARACLGSAVAHGEHRFEPCGVHEGHFLQVYDQRPRGVLGDRAQARLRQLVRRVEVDLAGHSEPALIGARVGIDAN
jgi:hypothetical protein